MIRFAAIALAMAAASATGATAATLAASGPVQVNSGSGFRPVSGVVDVRPGDRVLVGAGARATINYGSGCAMALSPNAVALVASGSPCAGRMELGRRAYRPAHGGEGMGLESPYLNTSMMIVGGGFAAATIGALAHTISKTSKSPSSP